MKIHKQLTRKFKKNLLLKAFGKAYFRSFLIFCLFLDKTLKDTQGVQLDNRKVHLALGPRTKSFESLFFNKL